MGKKLFYVCLVFAALCCTSCLPDRRASEKEAPLGSINYAELGFPSIDSVWGIDEYERAVKILSTIHKKSFKSLPRKNGKDSGRIFSRIISVENIKHILNDNLYRESPITFVKLLEELNFAYIDLSRERQYYHEELAEIEVFGLKFQDVTFSVVSNLNIDLANPEMMSAFEDMRSGYLTTVIGILSIQMEDVGYTEKDMLMISAAVSESLSVNLLLLSTDAIKTIADKMRLLINASKSRKVRNAYLKILKSLQ
jgi:hypothetical protein